MLLYERCLSVVGPFGFTASIPAGKNVGDTSKRTHYQDFGEYDKRRPGQRSPVPKWSKPLAPPCVGRKPEERQEREAFVGHISFCYTL